MPHEGNDSAQTPPAQALLVELRGDGSLQRPSTSSSVVAVPSPIAFQLPIHAPPLRFSPPGGRLDERDGRISPEARSHREGQCAQEGAFKAVSSLSLNRTSAPWRPSSSRVWLSLQTRYREANPCLPRPEQNRGNRGDSSCWPASREKKAQDLPADRSPIKKAAAGAAAGEYWLSSEEAQNRPRVKDLSIGMAAPMPR